MVNGAPMERLLDVNDIIAITRLSRSKVYDLVRKGILSRIQLPDCDRILVRPEDLRTFLANRK